MSVSPGIPHRVPIISRIPFPWRRHLHGVPIIPRPISMDLWECPWCHLVDSNDSHGDGHHQHQRDPESWGGKWERGRDWDCGGNTPEWDFHGEFQDGELGMEGWLRPDVPRELRCHLWVVPCPPWMGRARSGSAFPGFHPSEQEFPSPAPAAPTLPWPSVPRKTMDAPNCLELSQDHSQDPFSMDL